MLWHVMEELRAVGIREFCVITGYGAEPVEAACPPGTVVLRQQERNGTARAALLAREFADGERVLLTFADILSTGYGNVIASAGEAVVGVRDVDDPFQGAAVYATQGRIERIIEKPPKGTSSTRWNSAGVFALAPVVFEYLERVPLSLRGEYELTTAFEMMLGDGRDLRMAELTGYWRDVGRPEDVLPAELIAMAAEDDRVRAGVLERGYPPRMAEVHDRNAARLQALIREHGWPGPARVGSEAGYAAWLVLQHAINHPGLMRRGLELLGADVPGEWKARTEDRIRLYEGRPQRYGTNTWMLEDGTEGTGPIEEPELLNERRAAMGLPPLAPPPKGTPRADVEEHLREREAWLRRAGWR
jgi:dTDP-glucose pyrophosphorylase